MVGGLVQNQQIDFFIHQHAQSQTGLLAAGEVANAFEHILPLEQKRAQPVPRCLGCAVLFIEHGVVEAALGVVKVDDLGQVSPFHSGPELDFSAAVLLPQKTLDKGGFSCAVVAQKGDPLPCLHIQVHIGKKCPVAKGLGYILHFEHHVAGKILFSEGGFHGLFRLWLFGFPDAVHPVLNGHGPAVQGSVVDAPALHPLHSEAQLLELGLFLLILLQLQIKPGLLFVHIEGVVTGIEFRVSVADLNHPLGHLVDEIPVVGDGQHRALKGMDILLQPLHTVQIQMVGGLVQQQNVRLFQQQPGQIHPGLFAAGEAGKRLNPLLLGDAQAIADFIRLHIHVIAAAGLEAVGKIVVLPQLLRRCPGLHLLLQCDHVPLQLKQTGIGRAKHILHGVALREHRNLGNQAKTLVGVDVHLPLVVVQLPGEDAKQGGFAAAVPSENGNALPLLHIKAQPLQQVFPDDKKLC